MWIFPIVLWALVWFGLKAGHIQDIAHEGGSLIPSTIPQIAAYAGIVPIAAGLFSCFVILRKFAKWGKSSIVIFGPLGFITLYGVIGLISTTQSTEMSYAFYWTLLYLSVPVVLLGSAWGPRNLEHITSVIRFNTIVILLAVVILYTLGLFHMDLGKTLIDPTSWFDCTALGDWYIKTGGQVRGTGVGRFAGIAVVLSIPGMFFGRPRFLWILVGLASLLLLLSTGARTAFVCVAVAIPITLYLCSRKKSVLILDSGLIVTLVFLLLH